MQGTVSISLALLISLIPAVAAVAAVAASYARLSERQINRAEKFTQEAARSTESQKKMGEDVDREVSKINARIDSIEQSINVKIGLIERRIEGMRVDLAALMGRLGLSTFERAADLADAFSERRDRRKGDKPADD